MGLSFDRVADRYDATRGYPENIMRDIVGAIEEGASRELLMLDAGVGTGRFAKPLQDRGFQVVGIDISQRMLQKAVEKGTQDLLRGDVCHLPFQDCVFAVTLSIHVLHLISTWQAALGEVARVTTDKFVSIAFRKENSPAQEIRDFYDRICAELGYTIRHPGLREREMPDLLPPDVERPIVFHEHPIKVEDLIDEFETRTYSSQWFVPDEIHSQAIEAMRERFGDIETVIGRESISLLEWDAKRLWKLSAGVDPGEC